MNRKIFRPNELMLVTQKAIVTIALLVLIAVFGYTSANGGTDNGQKKSYFSKPVH